MRFITPLEQEIRKAEHYRNLEKELFKWIRFDQQKNWKEEWEWVAKDYFLNEKIRHVRNTIKGILELYIYGFEIETIVRCLKLLRQKESLLREIQYYVKQNKNYPYKNQKKKENRKRRRKKPTWRVRFEELQKALLGKEIDI